MRANKCQDMLVVAVLLAGYVLRGSNTVLQVSALCLCLTSLPFASSAALVQCTLTFPPERWSCPLKPL